MATMTNFQTLTDNIYNQMSNRKYIHLQLWKIGKSLECVKINGKELQKSDFTIFIIGQKNLAIEICKELYPTHEIDLHEKFLRDYIRPLGDFHIIDQNVDITEFCQYARDVIRIKQEAGVESIEDILPF